MACVFLLLSLPLPLSPLLPRCLFLAGRCLQLFIDKGDIGLEYEISPMYRESQWPGFRPSMEIDTQVQGAYTRR